MAILTQLTDSVRADFAGSASWQAELKAAIRDLPTLLEALRLPPTVGQPPEGPTPFPVFVPRPFLARMEPGNPHDPLLRQVLPVAAENDAVPGFVSDPLQESEMTRSPGLLQKYTGRVLMVLTGACAIHCRYCFRRHFPYQESPRSIDQWRPALDAIAADASIREVLLSGGDPLTLVDETLVRLVQALEAIPHLKRLRIHSRLPVVIPARLTPTLNRQLSETRLRVTMVIHANHPQELDDQIGIGLRPLQLGGVQLLNQSVLLKGVNDNAEALIGLSERLLDYGVLPYYLHQLDPVAGAAHFQVSVEAGRRLMELVRRALPGYAVPRYVQELAGEPYKTVLA